MTNDNHLVVPVSIGELFDKVTILELKLRHARSEQARRNIELEHGVLTQILINRGLTENAELAETAKALLEVNEQLWNVEDKLREFEHRRDFGNEFVQSARSVYILNDKRAAIKKSINNMSGSTIVEEKLYASY